RDDRRVLALTDLAAAEVAAREHVGEAERVRAGDLDDVLDRDVPQRHVLEEMPVLDDRVLVVGRQVRVVVDVVGRAPVTQRRVEEGRLPVPGPEVKRRARRVLGGDGLVFHHGSSWGGAQNTTRTSSSSTSWKRCSAPARTNRREPGATASSWPSHTKRPRPRTA